MTGWIVALALGAEPAVAPLAFDEAVQQALARHPALTVAATDVRRAQALVEQARAPSLPSLSGTLAYTRLDGERKLADRVVAGQDQLTGNLSLSVPLVSAPRWAQWRRAEWSLDAARATADDVRRQVAVNAARAWLTALGQKRVLEAAERAAQTARAHLEYAQGRSAGGVGSTLEVVRARQEAAAAQAQVAQAKGALARVQEALGVATAAEGPLDAQGGEPALTAPGDEAPSLDEARRDVKAARARAEAARAATTLDWWDYAPLLNAVFQPFTQNPPSLTQPQFGWQAQVVLTVPLYEGGLRYGQAHERRAVADGAQAQVEATLRQARSEVRAAFALVQAADEALVAARDSEAQARAALDLATTAWRAGANTNLEVIDAERRARDAATQVALAEDAARQARLELLAASGRFP